MSEIWRPVLVKIVIIKLPHKSVFSATVIIFVSLLCICIGGTIFFFLRWLLIIFSNVNYFNLSLLNFFVGSTNDFCHSCCKLFLTGIANYFLLLEDNYFFIGAKNYFFVGAENYFSLG